MRTIWKLIKGLFKLIGTIIGFGAGSVLVLITSVLVFVATMMIVAIPIWFIYTLLQPQFAAYHLPTIGYWSWLGILIMTRLLFGTHSNKSESSPPEPETLKSKRTPPLQK